MINRSIADVRALPTVVPPSLGSLRIMAPISGYNPKYPSILVSYLCFILFMTCSGACLINTFSLQLSSQLLGRPGDVFLSHSRHALRLMMRQSVNVSTVVEKLQGSYLESVNACSGVMQQYFHLRSEVDSDISRTGNNRGVT